MTVLSLLPSGLKISKLWCWRLYALVHAYVAQRSEGCQSRSLPRSHSANGPDMNKDPSSQARLAERTHAVKSLSLSLSTVSRTFVHSGNFERSCNYPAQHCCPFAGWIAFHHYHDIALPASIQVRRGSSCLCCLSNNCIGKIFRKQMSVQQPVHLQTS